MSEQTAQDLLDEETISDIPLEVVDVEPTEEQQVSKAKVDGNQIKERVIYLNKTKTKLEQEVSFLEKAKLNLDAELITLRGKVTSEIQKMGEVVTKKIAALEVVNQIKKTQTFLIILLVPFLVMNAVGKSFLITSLVNAVFLLALGYHFVMNKRKETQLKVKYGL